MNARYALLCVGLAACQPRPFPEDNLPVAEQRPVTGTFQATYDTVWEATIEVLGDIAPFEVIEKDQGVITTNWMYGFSDYIFKTYAGTKIPEPIRTRWEVEITSREGRTQVVVVTRSRSRRT